MPVSAGIDVDESAMSVLLDGTDQLERELMPEPTKGPAIGSLVLHSALFGTVLFWGVMQGWFRHSLWGNEGTGGAVQVTLVSSALPLPSKEPVNQNVLSTEKPSEAPTPPQEKTKQEVDESAIPIQGKQKKPQKETEKRNVAKPTQPVEQNRAQYGEQSGSSMPRSTQQAFQTGQTSVSDANFGSMFGWYVGQIDRKMDANGYRNMADPRTPKGAKASIEFKVYRDGSHGDVRLDASSGSPSWDNVCVRAAQRVDTFGSLPPGYRGSYLQVFYDCTY